jgi:hypothetical protein
MDVSRLDLIIIVLSTPEEIPGEDWDISVDKRWRGSNDNWYRIQSEQTLVDQQRAKSKCIMYVKDVMVNRLSNVWVPFKVAQNIYKREGWREHWQEYHNINGLAAAISAQIDVIVHEVDVRASWKKTIEKAVQNRIGANWIQSVDRLIIDTFPTDTDLQIAKESTAAQLHQNIKRKADAFVSTATRLDNSVGWTGIAGSAARFFTAVNVDQDKIAENLGNAYDALLELASFFEQDSELQKGTASIADPLDPEVRRKLRALIRSAAPWLRQFPNDS